jgi:hypothetical protein
MSRKRQIGVALDEAMRQRLEALAAAADRSLADEIRERLALTLAQDELDPKTRALAASIGDVAGQSKATLRRDWYESRAGYELMREAILRHLDELRPREWDREYEFVEQDPAAAAERFLQFAKANIGEEQLRDLKTYIGESIREAIREAKERDR